MVKVVMGVNGVVSDAGGVPAHRKGVTKSGGRKHALDKFYTRPERAAECPALLDVGSYDVVFEPSAGAGAFSSQVEGCVAFDLAPEAEGVVCQDWFLYERERVAGERVLVVGNPPYGQQNSLAVKFINHAAKFADTVAFVLPLSFLKESVQARLHPNLHLVSSTRLGKDSFLLDGVVVDVPAVFQVWEFDDSKVRSVPVVPAPVGFRFVRKEAGADLFLQRIGGRAGRVGADWEGKNPESHYFLKVEDVQDVPVLMEELSRLSFPGREQSVGPRSVSQKEVLRELGEAGSRFVTRV